MKSKFHFFIFVLFLVTLLIPSATRANERVDLYMTKAKHAMNVGDDAGAFSWFAKVVEIEPGNVTALHLQGVTASRLGRFARATEILKKCIGLQGASPEAHYDLGFVLYTLGRYREAAVQFETARQNQVKEAALPYYLGASLFRLKEYVRAVEPLKDALETVLELQANVHFYLGATYYALKKYSSAQTHLEKNLELAPESPVAAEAEQLLRAAIIDKNLAKWWDLNLEIGVAYDSNVLYEPEDLEVTDQKGYYIYANLDAIGYPLKRRKGSIGLGYNFYQSFHFAPENELAGDFDLQRHAGRLETIGRIINGFPGLYFGAEYEGSYATLGTRYYQDQHQVTPVLSIPEVPMTSTRVATIVQIKKFTKDHDARDGLFLEPRVEQVFSFMQNKGQATLEIGYQQNDADSDDFDYMGVRAFGGALIPVVADFSTIFGVQYRYLDYINNATGRVDRKVTADAGFRYTVYEMFSFQLSYRFAQNDSTERFSWEKHVTTFSFKFHY